MTDDGIKMNMRLQCSFSTKRQQVSSNVRQTPQKAGHCSSYLATLPFIELADLPCFIAHGTRSLQQPHVPTSMSAEAVAQMSSAVRAEPCAPAQPVASNKNRDSHQQLGIEASFADARIADWS